MQSQGVQLATIQKLARYWATEYDWRKVEAKLNALPQFITEIDGLDIHFIHVRSKHENALPLIVTHGWPGSVIEQLKIIDPLTNPTAHGGSAADAFHVVIPSMPGYGFSGKPTTTGWDCRAHRPRLGRADEAPRLHAIRGARRRLGCARHGADGRAGAAGIARHPHQPAFRRTGRNYAAALTGHVSAARPLGRRKARVRRLDVPLPTACPTPSRWRPTRRRCTESRIRRSASPPGSSTTTCALRAHRTRLRRDRRRPHAGRRARQHHALSG